VPRWERDSADIRQLPDGFEARITSLTGLGNGKSRVARGNWRRDAAMRWAGASRLRRKVFEQFEAAHSRYMNVENKALTLPRPNGTEKLPT